ncbi:4-hydroxy-tetrahydrodipicolinate synthase [Paraburkholderia sp. JHI869]|uniref:4-hydroxy-tetrahydrodipicolinate synthase family protein n=1 Tax=Paraburkholderia sp. JHI869 TaxID=3112959 RepID=UPI00317A4D61
MFEGIWLPIVTPLRDGAVDIEALERLTDEYASDGIAGIVALSTTGEAALLSDVERVTVLQVITEVAAGRVPVIAGLGGSDTHTFVQDLRALEKWDVAGFLAPPPSYVCPDQAGLAWHFGQIARATSKPVVLYDVPHRTGVSIEVETVRELAEIDNIVAIKACASERFKALGELPIALLCGTDEAFLECLEAGATGGILASAHICPDLLHDVRSLVKAGYGKAASRLFARFKGVLRLLFAAPNPSAIKAMLALDGAISPETRMPILPASPALVTQLEFARAVLDDLRAVAPSA